MALARQIFELKKRGVMALPLGARRPCQSRRSTAGRGQSQDVVAFSRTQNGRDRRGSRLHRSSGGMDRLPRGRGDVSHGVVTATLNASSQGSRFAAWIWTPQ
jgi:hypothetical protein